MHEIVERHEPLTLFALKASGTQKVTSLNSAPDVKQF